MNNKHKSKENIVNSVLHITLTQVKLSLEIYESKMQVINHSLGSHSNDAVLARFPVQRHVASESQSLIAPGENVI